MTRGGPNDAAEALRCYEESLAIRRRLHEDNPGSAQAARDVSVSLDRLGDLLARRGGPNDAAEALRCCEESLAIRKRLREDNPGSAQAVSDLFYAIRIMPFIYRKAGEFGKAFRAGQDLNSLLEHMEKQGFEFDNTMQQELSNLKKNLRRLLLLAGGLGIMLLAGIGYAIWRLF